ncbi:hypothetical protein LTR84_010010 [Exophiala bonariae]|uniref:Uncharacterized protein n=1 Tax=Exophiala bonariae TaxID=1690606 RepID=A0AAV9NK94_9EURO|nr:hypothetical protein LTR84_010010 [Exophiala bonariae]
MHSSTTSALLLTSLISAASAFVPMQIAPLPTDLDTNGWKAFTTLPAEPVPTAASSSPQPTPTETSEEIFEILPFPVPSDPAELKKRQGVNAAIPPVVTQVSPITTYQIDGVVNGVATRLNVVYTQTFNPIPDQWPSPTEAGTIGLGTIVGEIGVVKTKRSLPTQAPLAESPDPSPTAKSPEAENIPLLEKLRKAGKEMQAEVEELLNKVKKPAFEGNTLMDKLRKAGKEVQEEVEELLNKVKKPAGEKNEDSSLPLEKEFRSPTSASSTSKVPIPFGTPSGSEEVSTEPFHFNSGSENKGASNLLPEERIHGNDARVLKAGSLAIIAVTIGTLCVNYL